MTATQAPVRPPGTLVGARRFRALAPQHEQRREHYVYGAMKTIEDSEKMVQKIVWLPPNSVVDDRQDRGHGGHENEGVVGGPEAPVHVPETPPAQNGRAR